MPISKDSPSDRVSSTTGLSALALIGWAGLPSSRFGTLGRMASQTSLETVMALPFRSMLNAVTISDLLPPTPMLAPMGCPASM